MKVYKHIASRILSRSNCERNNNPQWHGIHEDSILQTVRDYMPSGSGIDTGTKINLDKSTPNKLVFEFSYHHMSEFGMYTKWTSHTCIVTPSLVRDFDMRITGQDYNGIKEYLYQTFDYALNEEVKE